MELAAFAEAQTTPDPSRADQCGLHRVVSLMSSEAVRELGLAPAVLAVAVVKSTQVMVESPGVRA